MLPSPSVKKTRRLPWLSKGSPKKVHSLGLQLPDGRIEIIHLHRQMPDARIFHPLRGAFAFRRDDLEHGSILRLDEIVAGVLVIDPEPEMLDVPFGELLRDWAKRSPCVPDL